MTPQERAVEALAGVLHIPPDRCSDSSKHIHEASDLLAAIQADPAARAALYAVLGPTDPPAPEPLQPDDGHKHSFGCRLCGVDPAPAAWRGPMTDLEVAERISEPAGNIYPAPEPLCCADKGGAWCRDSTAFDHCVAPAADADAADDALAFLRALLASPVWPAGEDVPVPRKYLEAALAARPTPPPLDEAALAEALMVAEGVYATWGGGSQAARHKAYVKAATGLAAAYAAILARTTGDTDA